MTFSDVLINCKSIKMNISISFFLTFFCFSYFAHFTESLSDYSKQENRNISFQNELNLEQKFDSIRFIQLTRIDGKIKKQISLKQGSFIILKTNDSLTYRCKIEFIDSNSIRIKNHIVAIDNIKTIKKPVLSARIFGNTFGFLFTILSLGLIESQGVEEGLSVAPLALPFYSMNFIKRKYDLERKWKLEIKFHEIKKNSRKNKRESHN